MFRAHSRSISWILLSCLAAACTGGDTHARAESSPSAPNDTTPAPFSLSAPLSHAQQHWVDSTLAELSLRERVGQMVQIWVLGDYTNWDDSSFTQIRRAVVEYGIGGINMSLGSPIEVAAKINALQQLAPVPLLVASDLEPGLGRLNGGVHLPSLLPGGSATLLTTNMAIGATGREEDAHHAGRITGIEARAAGINVVFAPTSDVNNNPANPVINTRSFGEDPRAVAQLAAAFVRGVQERGVMATAKHFPGHGDTDTDSHLALPVVKSSMARLDSVELPPFREAIAAGVGGVMTAHIALPALGEPSTPATLVPGIVTGLLRDTLGFSGLVFTDALAMQGIGRGYGVGESAVLAVKAGADVLLQPTDVAATIQAVVSAVEKGEIASERIERSVRAILETKARLGLDHYAPADLARLRRVVGAPAHWDTARSIARRAITLIRDRDGNVPVPARSRVAVVTYAPENELVAGQAFAAEVLSLAPGTSISRVSPRTSQAALDSLARALRGADRVIISTNVRTIEGRGRPALPEHISQWVNSLAARQRTIVIANGNPYVVRDFLDVGTYMVTYGIDPLLERASARAVFGAAQITGRSPISLPGYFSRGDGLTREAVR